MHLVIPALCVTVNFAHLLGSSERREKEEKKKKWREKKKEKRERDKLSAWMGLKQGREVQPGGF